VSLLATFSPSHVWQLLALLGAGIAGGAVNAIAGGGSVITFPVLLFVGVGPILANATNTVAIWPGSVAGAYGFRKDVVGAPRSLYWLVLPSIGGGTVGALVLLHTPSRVFELMAPYLVLAATVLLAVQGVISRRVHRDPARARSGRWWAVAVVVQLAISVYGGFFGAGISIVILAVLGLIGFTDIHRMNGLKNLYAACINGAALVYFVASGAVVWSAVAIMVGGTVAGGIAAARFAHRIGRGAIRRVIVGIGIAMAVALLLRVYL
jgi:uncharacterized membrane protein YfcA